MKLFLTLVIFIRDQGKPISPSGTMSEFYVYSMSMNLPLKILSKLKFYLPECNVTTKQAQVILAN